MKKNVLFLAGIFFLFTPLATASDDYYDYPYVTTDTLTLRFPYETDAGTEGGFGFGFSLRNPKDIFEETKKLLELSGTPQSSKTRYYLSPRFKDLQEKDGQYIQDPLFRYIHAINALRNDLHSQENINRLVTALRQRADLSIAQKQSVLDIEKDMYAVSYDPQEKYRPRRLEKIRKIIALFNTTGQPIHAIPYPEAREPRK